MNKQKYWLRKRPSDGKKWAYTTSADVLEGEDIKQNIYHMYRRYVKQWNDIELDMKRCLSEHTNEIYGAKIVGGGNKSFILHKHENNKNHWILEVFFSRGFHQYYPGFSLGLNTLRNTNDIRSIHLHWSDSGHEEFTKWLSTEKQKNISNGEWKEYNS